MHHRDTAETLQFRNRIPLDGNAVRDEVFLFEYLPKECSEGRVYKSFVMGWVQALEAVRDVLRARAIPTVATVRRTLASGYFDHRYTKHFLQNGGGVEYAIAAVLGRSKEEHEHWGDASFLDLEEGLMALPAVEALDDDYELVRAKLAEATPMTGLPNAVHRNF